MDMRHTPTCCVTSTKKRERNWDTWHWVGHEVEGSLVDAQEDLPDVKPPSPQLVSWDPSLRHMARESGNLRIPQT